MENVQRDNIDNIAHEWKCNDFKCVRKPT